MADEIFPTTYTARWVGGDYSGIPRASVAGMLRDDIAAKREADDLAAAAEDARDAVATRCRVEGRDCSMAGVLARAERGFRQTDYRDEREAMAARMTAGEPSYLRDRPRGHPAPGRARCRRPGVVQHAHQPIESR